jgi:hypothetical protein
MPDPLHLSQGSGVRGLHRERGREVWGTDRRGCTLKEMPHFNATTKHHILLEYAPHERDHSFAALAARHSIAGGKRTVLRWWARWDGTSASLEEGMRTGRPRVLSAAQVRRHIAAPIRNANRAARPVRYTQLLPQVQAATGTQMAISTLKNYGKQELGAAHTRGKKRTAGESEFSHAAQVSVWSVFVES